MEVSLTFISPLISRDIQLPGRSSESLQVSYPRLKSLVEEFSSEDVSISTFFEGYATDLRRGPS
jgi:hypothetical protein